MFIVEIINFLIESLLFNGKIKEIIQIVSSAKLQFLKDSSARFILEISYKLKINL